MATADFGGFGPDLLGFLEDLSKHNDRDWFQANKKRYQASVQEPARAFVRAMAPRLRKLSSHVIASDKKVGGTLMRINRDARRFRGCR